MNVCKKKYISNMIQTDFVNIHDIYDVDKPQLNVTFVKICICWFENKKLKEKKMYVCMY